jgi:RNA polymerase sigma factor (sigma-70 family)
MISVSSDCAGMNVPPAFVDSPLEPIARTAASEAVTTPEVSDLTARLARGDETAFHEFYQRYFNRLLRYLLVVANGNEELAREALQLTFLRVARHVRRFDSEPVFWGWLTVLARSSITDEQRKFGRYQALLARFFLRQSDSSENQPKEERFLSLVREELDDLPSDERELIERKYFNNEPVRELAEACQLGEKAMESRLLRIRRKLKAAVLDRLRHETTD